MMNDRIAYTDEMLSTIFRRPLPTVRLALQTFEQFDMVEIVDGTICISNWEKHQNVDKLEQLREYNRLAQQKSRQRKKLLSEKCQDDVNDKSMTSQECQDTDKIREDKDKILSKESTRPHKKKYGEYKHVLLTDDEFQKLHNDFPNADDAITYLDEYIEMKGTKYKSHYLALRKWVFDALNERKNKETKPKETGSFDTDDFFEAAVERSYKK